MRIIKHGKHPREAVMRGRCIQCKTEIECKKGEAKSSPDQREPGFYVDCPTCGYTIWVREVGKTND